MAKMKTPSPIRIVLGRRRMLPGLRAFLAARSPEAADALELCLLRVPPLRPILQNFAILFPLEICDSATGKPMLYTALEAGLKSIAGHSFLDTEENTWLLTLEAVTCLSVEAARRFNFTLAGRKSTWSPLAALEEFKRSRIPEGPEPGAVFRRGLPVSFKELVGRSEEITSAVMTARFMEMCEEKSSRRVIADPAANDAVFAPRWGAPAGGAREGKEER